MTSPNASRLGVLLLNLGTPSGTDYWSVRRYLKEFLWDARVIEPPPSRALWWLILNGIILTKRPFSSGEAYKGIWNNELNESPLLTITREQTRKLFEAFTARRPEADVVFDFAMRYGEPNTPDALRRMAEAGCDRILTFPLYPQYAAATTATANDQAFRGLMKLRRQPALRTVPAYYDHPLYMEALAGSVRRHLEARKAEGAPAPQRILCSYHGLPERYVASGDPYADQCRETTRLLGAALGGPEGWVESAFQSRFGKEEWVKPYTVARVADLARSGVTDIAILAPAFSADCVETLEEINEEIRESFVHAGGKRFDYIPCLNAEDAHVSALLAIVERELAGWLPEAPAGVPQA
ncbi:ferrochelatase [Neomegalonema sp.]|uniref:ferrochelatase n=1 Tax=Neomegalonema sp. TaxID=2039713 RepID=UPI002603C07A|nr:ferrochelatase [Neomegalonema sp.]MDD2868664.1 ferrochelatase [Neomegalonema sp.]